MQSYFPPLKDWKPLWPWKNQITPTAQIPRYTNLTEEAFFDVIRTGQPFVIDDCARDWPYRNWPCKKFGEKWPQGSMKAEYSDMQGHIKLGDGKWWSKVRKGDRQAQHMSEGKMVAGPYIWHVKDEEPEPVKQDVQKNWQAPPLHKCATPPFPPVIFFVVFLVISIRPDRANAIRPSAPPLPGPILHEQDPRQPPRGLGLV